MIVVDSSALLGILFAEPEQKAFQDIVDGVQRCLLSAVNAHETACVLRGRLGALVVARFWQWLIDNEVEIVPFDEIQARAAADAYGRYGKGINPKARLNLADCAAYALAKSMNAPLLFKGDDFSETDVMRAPV